MKKREGKRKKSSFRCHAILCERTDSPKALDSVAGYLENGHFHPINDINMPAYYQKVLEYCNLRLRGVEKRAVEVRVTTAGYLGPVNEYCEKIYERLQEDQRLKALLDKLEVSHQACMKVRDSILALPGFQFEN